MSEGSTGPGCLPHMGGSTSGTTSDMGQFPRGVDLLKSLGYGCFQSDARRSDAVAMPRKRRDARRWAMSRKETGSVPRVVQFSGSELLVADCLGVHIVSFSSVPCLFHLSTMELVKLPCSFAPFLIYHMP